MVAVTGGGGVEAVVAFGVLEGGGIWGCVGGIVNEAVLVLTGAVEDTAGATVICGLAGTTLVIATCPGCVTIP